jgi:hypothetical protein
MYDCFINICMTVLSTTVIIFMSKLDNIMPR